MHLYLVAILLLAGSVNAFGQMTPEQRALDFQSLASLFEKQYAPYGWKRDVIKFDLFDLRPWLDRISKAKDDSDFYQICEEYVASLNDVHSEYRSPSDFQAYLGFEVDLYDGKVLIDSIDRTVLAGRRYPFAIGDELISIDGRSIEDLINEIGKLQAFGNTRSTRRWAAGYVTYRPQSILPRASDLGENAAVVIRRQNGDTESYTIPWIKSGLPFTKNGPIPNPKLAALNRPGSDFAIAKNPENTSTGGEEWTSVKPTSWKEQNTGFDRMPSYLRPLLKAQMASTPRRASVTGFSQISPVFRLPANFVRRSNPLYYSGVYQSGGYKIGYLRVGDFQPTSYDLLDLAFSYFDREIKYLQANTDGLVLDVTRNGGGYGCFAEDIATRLIPYQFIATGRQYRPRWTDIRDYSAAIVDAEDQGAPNWVIELNTAYLAQIKTAYNENRGMTGPLPLCTNGFERNPVQDENGVAYAYTKPIVLLTDEFTTSAAETLAANFQDAKRGPIVGWRTAGAGGIVEQDNVGFFSEGSATVTVGITTRNRQVLTSDFPASLYIENVGVRPDVPLDYMTKDNLLNRGTAFVSSFTETIIEEIKKAAK